jgi:hypothetical protein
MRKRLFGIFGVLVLAGAIAFGVASTGAAMAGTAGPAYNGSFTECVNTSHQITAIWYAGGNNCGSEGTITWSNQQPPPGLAGAVYRYNNYPNGISPGGIATVECGDTDAVSETYVAVDGGVEVGTGTGFPTTSDLASTSQSLPIAASFPGVMDWTTNSPDAGRLDGWIVQTEVGYDANDTSATVWALCVPVADAGGVPQVQQDNNSNG